METYQHIPQCSKKFKVPNILTLHSEVYIGQELLLVQGCKKMKIVEVIGVREADGFVYLTLKDQCTNKVIELTCPLGHYPEYSITWMVISVPYIVELVVQRLKRGFE